MQEIKLQQDTPVLHANNARKSFSETGEIILKGSVIKGEPKYIKGVRKGEPFTFSLFLTDDNKLIYLNKAINQQNKKNNNMDKTEVTLGADGGKPQTVLNLKPSEYFDKLKIIGVGAGAAVGFAYCKYKKHDTKKTIIYTIVGAALGYGIAHVIDTHHSATLNSATGTGSKPVKK